MTHGVIRFSSASVQELPLPILYRLVGLLESNGKVRIGCVIKGLANSGKFIFLAEAPHILCVGGIELLPGGTVPHCWCHDCLYATVEAGKFVCNV